MVEVRLKNLTVKYGEVVAVNNINLVLEDRKFTVMLGPSGCGKTSTLRSIAGLTRPASGDIYIGERLVNDLYPSERNVAMVFQSYALYPHMNIFDNLAFCLRPLKHSKGEVERKVNDVAKRLHLHEFLGRYPAELSSGQQQRVAIGRALIREPAVLLLDEPLSQLDAVLREEMKMYIKKLQEDLAITTIHVTHDQTEAQALGDKIVVMDQGAIQQTGTPQEIYNSPLNLFVAGFIGNPPMNFIPGKVYREKGELFLVNTKTRIHLSSKLSKKLEEKGVVGEIILGIRPEHILLFPTAAANSIRARIVEVLPQNDEFIIHLDCTSFSLKVREDKKILGFRPQIDQEIWFALSEEKAYVFDKETTARIELSSRGD